jgi:hypothetical protein
LLFNFYWNWLTFCHIFAVDFDAFKINDISKRIYCLVYGVCCNATFKSQLGLMLCYIKLGLKYEVKTILAKLVESFKSDNIVDGENNDQTKLFDKDTFQSLNRTISCYVGSEFLGISCYFLLVRLSQDLNADKIDINYVYEEIVHNILGYKLR